MRITTGGSANRMIMVVSCILLFDSAYPRSAEKAREQFCSAYIGCKELELTAKCNEVQDLHDSPRPHIGPTAIEIE